MKFFNWVYFLLFLFACGTHHQDSIEKVNEISSDQNLIMTVKGPVGPLELGTTLIHEHFLVDFSGATTPPLGYEKQDVFQALLPYLKEVKKAGCQTIVECTPAFLGRDPVLLRMMSDSTGLHLITNTGYYGARNNRFIPDSVLEQSSQQIANAWIREFKEGIEGTGIRPGFIKMSVDRDSLSPFHKRLIIAAALAHQETGLTIASHTGPATPAFQQLAVLDSMGVYPEAFIWVHAQNEKDTDRLVEAAARGAWISMDHFNQKAMDRYVEVINLFRQRGLLHRLLISHDAGWYEPETGLRENFQPYTPVFDYLVPFFENRSGVMDTLLRINPARAFVIRKRLHE